MIAPLRWVSRLLSFALVLLVRLYQLTLRPILGGQCRFIPSCSEYFIEAVRRRGPVVGLGLGIWRILRCHPFGGSGYDPVPERRRRK
ncbi:MAG: membrane protein insertion efficiency factor YidD [Phycisphaerae bacterium]|nr:membrane protein insertion efficiency factor YidD [Phycisphaerae bacterium]